MTINRKPTIRFEIEQLTNRKVTMIAIVKSTYDIVSMNVGVSDVSKETWNIEKLNNEITTTARFDVAENGTYTWTVKDSNGNEIKGDYNVTTIDDRPSSITYKAYDATEYTGAKIEFSATNDVRIVKMILPDGTTTKVTKVDDIDGMRFSTTDFANSITVSIDREFKKGTIFVFENKAFIETSLEITRDIGTVVNYIRSVSVGGNSFDKMFEDEFGVEDAEILVRRAAVQTKEVDNKVVNYYGVSSTSITADVTDSAQINAATTLSNSIKSGNVLKMNAMGETQNLKATVSTSASDDGYLGGTVTGIKSYSNNIIGTAGTNEKTSFRMTLHAR